MLESAPSSDRRRASNLQPMPVVELNDRELLAGVFRRNAASSRLRARRPRRFRVASHAVVRLGVRRPGGGRDPALHAARRACAHRDCRLASIIDAGSPRATSCRRYPPSSTPTRPRRCSERWREGTRSSTRHHTSSSLCRTPLRSPGTPPRWSSSRTTTSTRSPRSTRRPTLARGSTRGCSRRDATWESGPVVDLACIAGVHVYSPRWSVAALGNVATAPELRGQGLARGACAALCRLLLDEGIETIALNVQGGQRGSDPGVHATRLRAGRRVHGGEPRRRGSCGGQRPPKWCARGSAAPTSRSAIRRASAARVSIDVTRMFRFSPTLS